MRHPFQCVLPRMAATLFLLLQKDHISPYHFDFKLCLLRINVLHLVYILCLYSFSRNTLTFYEYLQRTILLFTYLHYFIEARTTVGIKIRMAFFPLTRHKQLYATSYPTLLCLSYTLQCFVQQNARQCP